MESESEKRTLVAAVVASLVVAATACGGSDEDGGGGNGQQNGDGGHGSWLGELPPPTRLTIISVRAVAITPTSVVISWYTYVPASSQVDYGLDDGYGTTTPQDDSLVQDHRVVIDGLIDELTIYDAVF